ncbi:Hsp20/alpha crystallin family protein [bacterium]|jgi:HSP20 family protein|nr:Hsp20/alpha crystallin family protein [bacterium]
MFFQELASPFDSATQMHILQDRLSRLVNNIQEGRRNEFPPINVWASEKSIVVVAEVPGIDSEDIDLQVCNQTVTLKTKRDLAEAVEGQTYHRRERGHGQFTRSIELPYLVDAEKVNATFSNGMLRIEFSRAAADLPKKITVHAS